MKITEQLIALANEWSKARTLSTARLATIVANDGNFFERIARPGSGCTTNTVEKFLSFFRDGANWPDGRIPLAATELLDNFANIATEGGVDEIVDTPADAVASPGKMDAASPCAEAGRAA